MQLPAFPKLRILVLVAICAGLPRYLPAQLSTGLSGNLGQSLTDTPDTQPVTTLAIDLLAPQRSYVYDPTGASVLSTTLSPYLDRTNVSGVSVQTDTQIRDSSQTGQISPYAALASRLGVSSPNGTGTIGASPMNGGQFGDAAPTAEASFGEEYDRAGESSWGTSDSFGSRPSDGISRRTMASHAARLGLSQPTTGDSDLGAAGENLPQSGLTGDRNRKLTSLQPLTMPGTSLARGAPRRSGRTADSGGMPSNAGMPMSSGASGGAPTSGTSALLFSPQSYTEYSFGQSPFSSPAGNGELTFLSPNIFAAGSLRGFSSSEESSRERHGTLRERLEEEEGLATSSTGYGLASRQRGMESGGYGTRRNNKNKKSKMNPLLSDEEGNPDNQ